MFTPHELYKVPFTSAASRHVYKYKTARNWFWKAPHLSIKKKWNAGRNDSGTMVMRTRSTLMHKFKTIKINYNYNFFKTSFISNFVFIPYKNKTLSLVRYAQGVLAYYVSTENHKIFSLFRSWNWRNHIFNRLGCFPNLAFVCLIEIYPSQGAQYCRSSGTTSKILKFDYKTLMTIIRLPSGRSKAFSSFAFATSSRILFKENRKFYNSKAGYWRGFGFKPIVRGVAMNPVDHPHGGRTNSIKYPRTPWGKTTKYK